MKGPVLEVRLAGRVAILIAAPGYLPGRDTVLGPGGACFVRTPHDPACRFARCRFPGYVRSGKPYEEVELVFARRFVVLIARDHP